MENSESRLVFMQDVYSNEYYKSAGGSPVQVLRGVSFEASAGQSWCILGVSVFEIMLLTEIMAGARAYQKGTCSLAGFGMMRRKRTVLPHTLYIGSTNMLFNNMKVLEYLMFATSRNGEDALDRQQRILDGLIAAGLGHITLTPVELLDPEEKAAVLLFCATFSQSRLIILNLPRLHYDETLTTALAYIARMIRSDGKTLIFTTESFEAAQAISSHILLLDNGSVKYSGALERFLERYDKVVYSVHCDNAAELLPKLTAALPRFTLRLDSGKQDVIDVYDFEGAGAKTDLFSALHRLGVVPKAVLRNELNLTNAYRGFLRQHDL